MVVVVVGGTVVVVGGTVVVVGGTVVVVVVVGGTVAVVGGTAVVAAKVRAAPEAGSEVAASSSAQAERTDMRNKAGTRSPGIVDPIRVPGEWQREGGTAGDGSDGGQPRGCTSRGARLRWCSLPSLSAVNGHPHR